MWLCHSSQGCCNSYSTFKFIWLLLITATIWRYFFITVATWSLLLPIPLIWCNQLVKQFSLECEIGFHWFTSILNNFLEDVNACDMAKPKQKVNGVKWIHCSLCWAANVAWYWSIKTIHEHVVGNYWCGNKAVDLMQYLQSGPSWSIG